MKKGMTDHEWLDGIIISMDMSLSKYRQLVMDREAWACCSPWGHKESDMTEWLNWTLHHFATIPIWRVYINISFFSLKCKWIIMTIRYLKSFTLNPEECHVPEQEYLKKYIIYIHMCTSKYMFTYRYTQLSVTYTIFHKIKNKIP